MAIRSGAGRQGVVRCADLAEVSELPCPLAADVSDDPPRELFDVMGFAEPAPENANPPVRTVLVPADGTRAAEEWVRTIAAAALIALLETAVPLLLTMLGGMAAALTVAYVSMPREQWVVPSGGFFLTVGAKVLVAPAIPMVTWPLIDAATRHEGALRVTGVAGGVYRVRETL